MDVIQNKGDIVIYQTQDGLTQINVRFEDETVWLTQAQLVELYQSSKSNISEHIKHIFEEGELDEISVVRNFRTTASDGKEYNTKFYISHAKISHQQAMKKAAQKGKTKSEAAE